MQITRLSLALLSLSLGIPTSVIGAAAISPRCNDAFTTAWNKRVKAIHDWNAHHLDYVAKHNLNRDMSTTTKRSKKWLQSQLTLICGEVNENDQTSSTLFPPVGLHPWISTQTDLPFNPSLASTQGEVDTIPQSLSTLIADVDYPNYTSQDRNPPTNGGYYPGGFGGWYGGGGIINRNPPPTAPIAPTIAPIPEPAMFPLLCIVALAWLGWKGNRRCY